MRDWLEWHEAYAEPDSPLSRRLLVVQEQVTEALALLGDDSPLRVLSLCAGDGRDLLPVLARLRPDSEALLVELEPTLCEKARSRAAALGLRRVSVSCRHAGETAAFSGFVPVHLLLLCGVLGNVSEQDARRLVTALPALVSAGGLVVWTRGGRPPDRRPAMRRIFSEAGFEELSFTGEPEPFGVGLSRRAKARSPELPGGTLFDFV